MKTLTVKEFAAMTDECRNTLINGRAKIYYTSLFDIALDGEPSPSYDTLEAAEAANANGEDIYMIINNNAGHGDTIKVYGYEIGKSQY